jgi:hypothetical protein
VRQPAESWRQRSSSGFTFGRGEGVRS